MTQRLYYTDARMRAFDAVVRACDQAGDRWHVVLDQTAFYPTSGGQPFDTGRLGDVAVVDVIDREDGEIAHVLTGPVAPGTRVRGEIDDGRRLDHMQQHTGQHILSAAFDRMFEAQTVSFHMGIETSTIDLAHEVSATEVDRAAAEANRIVWADVSVDIRFASADEARALPLRKEPARTGPLRLVTIGDFDLSACGGTHVSRTGTVGLVAVTGTERFKGGTRVTFVCGGRARQSHAWLRDIVSGATRLLSVGASDLSGAIERMVDESKAAAKTIRDLREAVARLRGGELRAAADTTGLYRLVLRVEPTADGAELKALAQSVVSEPGFVAVFIGSGSPVPVVVARSSDVGFDAGALVKSVISSLGGRGGGRPELAQGGVQAPSEEVAAVVRRHVQDA